MIRRGSIWVAVLGTIWCLAAAAWFVLAPDSWPWLKVFLAALGGQLGIEAGTTGRRPDGKGPISVPLASLAAITMGGGLVAFVTVNPNGWLLGCMFLIQGAELLARAGVHPAKGGRLERALERKVTLPTAGLVAVAAAFVATCVLVPYPAFSLPSPVFSVGGYSWYSAFTSGGSLGDLSWTVLLLEHGLLLVVGGGVLTWEIRRERRKRLKGSRGP